MSILSKAYFHDEAAAFEYLENILWPDGPVCPHCGGYERISKIKANPEKRVRQGLHKCGQCKKQFTVRVGTVFEASKVELHKWLQAVYLMCASKKGISAHQLHRVLEVTYKTAWFMAHRIREAMRSGDLGPFGPMGGQVEVDETFIGHDKTRPVERGYQHKHKVLALVDRRTGKAKTMVVDRLASRELLPILKENISEEARVYTDEAGYYRRLRDHFLQHQSVKHNDGEYGRGEVHTNTVEGYFSIFKRGMKGVYQHCAKKHLHRYVAEFEFRYNNRVANGVGDATRTRVALAAAVGKRLTYRRANVE
ncbi:MAG: IS1595 family transposase [Pseudomonadota bacterium]